MILNRIILFSFGVAFSLLPLLRYLWDGWSIYLFFSFSLFLLLLFSIKVLFIDRTIPKPNLPIFLVLFWILFSISASTSPFKELSRLQTIVFLNATIFFFIVRNLQEDIRFTIKKVLCVVMVIFLLFYFPAYFVETISPYKDELFLKPNFVSSLALITFFLGVDLYPKIRPLSIAAILIATMAFFLSKSLASTLGLIVSFVWLGRGRLKEIISKIKGSWAILLLIPLLLIVCLSSWRVKSFDHRIGWWSMAAKITQQHPFFGSGPGSFEKISRDFYKEGDLRTPFVHNFPLQMASECGILTSLFLVLFILWEISISDHGPIVCAALALFIQNLFDYPLNIAGLLLLFFILLALGELPQPILLKGVNFKKRLGVFLLLTILIFGFAWSFSIKPLLSFQKTLQAQEDFKMQNKSGAELNLRKAMDWDKLALDPILNLSELLRMKALEMDPSPTKDDLLKEADSLDKKALNIDPTSLKYRVKELH